MTSGHLNKQKEFKEKAFTEMMDITMINEQPNKKV